MFQTSITFVQKKQTPTIRCLFLITFQILLYYNAIKESCSYICTHMVVKPIKLQVAQVAGEVFGSIQPPELLEQQNVCAKVILDTSI